jgi:PKD repeat protein
MSITFENSTQFDTKIYGLQTGSNTLKWVVYENGCKGEDYIMVRNNSFYTYAGENVVVYDDGKFVAQPLNAMELPKNADDGYWSIVSGDGNFPNDGSGDYDIHDPKSNVTDLGDGMNVFRWTVVYNGCTAYDDVQINFVSEEFVPRIIMTERQSNVCADSIQLIAKTQITGEGKWKLLSGTGKFDDASENITWLRGLKRGMNIIVWTATKNNYTAGDTIYLYNNTFDIAASAKEEVCEDRVLLKGQPAEADGYVDEVGEWGGYGTPDDRFSDTTYVSGLVPGNNPMAWSVSRKREGCPSCEACTAIDSLNIFYYAPPEAIFETSEKEGCSPMVIEFQNKSVDITNPDNTAIEYYWETSDGQIKREAEPTFLFENLSGQDVIYTYEVSLKATVEHSKLVCSSSYSDIISVYYTPGVDFSVSPESVEFSLPETPVFLQNLIIEDGTTYSYDYGDGKGGTEDMHSYKWFPTDSVQIANGWRYPITLTAENGNCRKDTVKYVQIKPPYPTSTISYKTKGCAAPFTYELDASDPNTLFFEKLRWEIKNIDKVSNATTSNQEIFNFTTEEFGTHVVKLFATGPRTLGEWTEDPIRVDTIEIWSIPFVDFDVEPDTVMLAGEGQKPNPVRFINKSVNGVEYLWEFDDGDNSNEASPTHVYQTEGTKNVILNVWTEHGCYDSLYRELPIVVLPPGDIRFPTAFSPDNSGPIDTDWRIMFNPQSNDLFYPIYLPGSVREDSYHLQIFNRWGSLIFETRNINEGWNGYQDNIGKPCGQDVYVWKVTGKYFSGQPFSKTGDVTLLW